MIIDGKHSEMSVSLGVGECSIPDQKIFWCGDSIPSIHRLLTPVVRWSTFPSSSDVLHGQKRAIVVQQEAPPNRVEVA